MKKLITAILVLTSVTASFGADGRKTQLKLLGVFNLTMPNLATAAAQSLIKSESGFGGGLLLEFPLGKVVGLELGGLYMPYSYKIVESTSVTDLKITSNYVSVPIGFKFHAGAFVFGFGGYFSQPMGNTKTSGTFLGANATTETTNSQNDYGAYLALGFDIKMGAKMSFLLEGRGLMGLKDFSGTKFNHAQGLAGFGINF